MSAAATFRRRPLLALGIALALLPAPGVAQQTDDSTADRPLASREELQGAVHRLESLPANASHDSTLRRLRGRLADGDFRPADRVLLAVEGESTLTDTFTVGLGRALELPAPTVGSLPLTGVLRSELQPVVTAYVRRFVPLAVVKARPLLRLSIQGEVVHAGIYGVPADAVLADAMMAAGGTTQSANMDKLKVKRAGEPVLDGKALQQAIADGRTLDRAGLRDGDQLIVGRRRAGGVGDGLRFAWIVVSLAGGVYGLSRAIH